MNRAIRQVSIAALALALAASPALAKEKKENPRLPPRKAWPLSTGKSIPLDRANAVLATVLAQGQPAFARIGATASAKTWSAAKC